MGGPGDQVRLSTRCRHVLVVAGQGTFETARKPEGAKGKGALGVGDMVQHLPDAPFLRRVAVQRFFFRDLREKCLGLFELILERANRVVVLTIEGGAAVPGPSGEQVCRYLRLNGVPAKPLTVALDGRVTGEAVLAHAKALGCDLLIKGAYTQSRLRQMIFGGTTRYILSNADLPVLMAH